MSPQGDSSREKANIEAATPVILRMGEIGDTGDTSPFGPCTTSGSGNRDQSFPDISISVLDAVG
jgi:hypothetical protein